MNTVAASRNKLRRRMPARNVALRIQRVARPYLQVAKKSQKKSPKTSILDINSAVNDLVSSLSSSFNNPTFLAVCLGVFALVATHQTAFSSGVIGKWATQNHDNLVAKWLIDNSQKFLGLVIFLPAVFGLSEKRRTFVGIASFIWITMIPESSVYQYCLQSLAIHAYFRVKRSSTKFLIIAAIAAAYTFGWIEVFSNNIPSRTPGAATANAAPAVKSG